MADESIESEACKSIDSDDSEYLEYVRELEERYAVYSDRSNGCDDAGAALGGLVWVPGEIRLAERNALEFAKLGAPCMQAVWLQGVW